MKFRTRFLTLFLFSFLFTSCFNNLKAPKETKVSFKMDRETVNKIIESSGASHSSRAVDDEEVPEYFIDVTLCGDQEETKSSRLTGEVSIDFENVLVNTRVYAKAQIYNYADKDKTSKIVIYRGQSKPITVHDRVNILSIKLTAATLTVTFESNGGSPVKAQTVITGQTVEEPEKPVKPAEQKKYSRENYAFAGWYTDEALTKLYDFNLPVTDDLTLYAKWLPDFVFVEGSTVENYLVTGRNLRISDLFVSDHEVTQKEYLSVTGKNPSNFNSDENLPVENVTWFEVIEYCNMLSEKEGLELCYVINGSNVTCSLAANGFRLPTEAEWEYIADKAQRTNTDFENLAFTASNSNNRTHPVKYSRADELNLCDIFGNVAEWCFDVYSDTVTKTTGPTGPNTIPGDSNKRVVRGGSYNTDASECKPSQRDSADPLEKSKEIGFRLVRSDVNEFKIIKNSVTFKSNGGSAVDIQSVVDGECALQPATPTRTGYEFKGWIYDGATFDFSTPITMDIVLEAKWQPIVYTISYDLDGGTETTANPTSYTIETETFELHNPTRALWNFKGWFNGSNKITKIEKGSYGNLSLTARWTQCHIVTFNTNGAATTIEEQEVENNSYATLPDPAPEKTGYDFTYWYTTNQNTSFDFEGTPITGNLTLNALWTPHEYTITYDPANGTITTADPDTYTIETTTFTLHTPARDGYDFEGWFDSTGNKVTQVTLGSTGDLSLTAQWLIHDYAITYDLNASDPVGANSNVANDSDNPVSYTITTPTITLKPATRTGYTFQGWKDDDTGNLITEITLGTHKDFTLVAQWQEETQNTGITVTFGVTTGDDIVVNRTEIDDGNGVITSIKYTVTGTYSTYYWEFDNDEITASSDTTYTITTSNLVPGVYDVYLRAVNDGAYYSWSQQIIIN